MICPYRVGSLWASLLFLTSQSESDIWESQKRWKTWNRTQVTWFIAECPIHRFSLVWWLQTGYSHSSFLLTSLFFPQTTIQNRNETVPLLGRNALLGEYKTHTFVDVVSGQGRLSDCLYVTTLTGLLCLLIDRQIYKTVDLKVSDVRTLGMVRL